MKILLAFAVVAIRRASQTVLSDYPQSAIRF